MARKERKKTKDWRNSRVFSYLSKVLAAGSICLGMAYEARFYGGDSEIESKREVRAENRENGQESLRRTGYNNSVNNMRAGLHTIGEKIIGPILRTLDETLFGK